MRRLPVDLMELEEAMTFPSDDFEYPQESYLDLQTGDVLWVWESDDNFEEVLNVDPAENQRNREAVEKDPDRFVAIPILDTIDDNEMLRDFVSSSWTEDDARWQRASNAYRGSVGRWKKAIDHDPMTIHAWHAFEQQAVRRRVIEFLAEHDIDPIDANKGD